MPLNAFQVERVADGDLVFDGLKAGYYQVSGELFPYLKTMSDDGSLWPFAVWLEFYDLPTDTCTVLLREDV